MRRIACIAFLAILISPGTQATATGPDIVLDLSAQREPPSSLPHLSVLNWTPGERVVWNVTTSEEFLVLEIQATGFMVERPRQLVPTLQVGSGYELFEHVAFADLWTAESPQRLAHVSRSEGAVVLRLGIPGPADGTLTLTRDLTPPTVSPGPRSNATHYSFYQATRTDELAIVDLQIRDRERGSWVENPTPIFHYLQRFPIQGLDPDTVYETRFVATDWAGNEAMIDGGSHHTPKAPERAALLVVPVSPPPGTRIRETNASVTAEFPEGTVLEEASGIRFFFDKSEVRENLLVEGNRVTYEPAAPLSNGPHSVSVEVTSQDGAYGMARWTFHVGNAEAPAAAIALVIAIVALAGLAIRRR